MASFSPTVVDISHYDVMQSDGFGKLARGGYKGVIHKATQGTGLVDITYASRRRDCVDAGLEYGAYHFADSSDPIAQADHFLAVAQPDDSTLLALDWETNGAHTMSAAQARVFLDRVCAKTARTPASVYIYGGNVLKEEITTAADMAYFGQYKLWLCQYGARPKVPKAWDAYTIWQYTGDAEGNPPHSAPGVTISPGVDNNVVCDGFDWDKDWGACKPAPLVVAQSASISSLADISRKVSGMQKFKTALKGMSLAGVLSSLGMAQSTADQVSAVIANHWLAILITAAALLYLGVKWWESLTVQDVNAGRYTPSGAKTV